MKINITREALEALTLLHLIPDGEEQEHEANTLCPCGPTVNVARHPDGSIGGHCDHPELLEASE